MTEPSDKDAGAGRPARPRAAWMAAGGIVLAALLLGGHSARRLLAVTASNPRPFPAPSEAEAQERALHGALRAVSWDGGDDVSLARAGALHFAKAERLLKEGKPDEARAGWTESLELLRRALAANPLDAASHREIVLVLERLGFEAEADVYAGRAARLFPAHPDLQYKLGLFYLERRALRGGPGEAPLDLAALGRAFDCFRKAAEADPAILDRALEVVEGAMPGLEDPSALVPETLPARLRYARFLARKGRWAESARIEEEAIARGEDGAERRLRAGESRLRAGEEAPAVEHFQAAFDRWLLSPNQVRLAGDAFLAARKEAVGLDFFLRLERLDPEEVLPVHMAVGRLYWSLGRWSEAEKYFGQAAVEESDAEAYYYLALLSERIGDLYAAERNLKQALRGYHARPEYHHKMGQIFEKMDRVSDALREYEMAFRMAPGNEAYRRDKERMATRWQEGK